VESLANTNSTYLSAMSTLPVRVGFSTSKTSLVSKIIRWFTKSSASHCFFVYYDVDWKRDMVMEATQGGFRIVPYTHYEGSIVALFTPKMSLDDGLVKAVEWLGADYDYFGLFGMAWVELGRWLKKKWKNPWRDPQAMFCSEAVAFVMIESNYPGTEDWDSQSIDPEMLIEFFKAEEERSSLIPTKSE
jgi:hypothetical protein